MVPKTRRYDLITNLSSFDELEVLRMLENIETKFEKKRVVKSLSEEYFTIRSIDDIEPGLVFFDNPITLKEHLKNYEQEHILKKQVDEIIAPQIAVCYKFRYKNKKKSFAFFNMGTLSNFCMEDRDIIFEHEMYHLLTSKCMMPSENEKFIDKMTKDCAEENKVHQLIFLENQDNFLDFNERMIKKRKIYFPINFFMTISLVYVSKLCEDKSPDLKDLINQNIPGRYLDFAYFLEDISIRNRFWTCPNLIKNLLS